MGGWGSCRVAGLAACIIAIHTHLTQAYPPTRLRTHPHPLISNTCLSDTQASSNKPAARPAAPAAGRRAQHAPCSARSMPSAAQRAQRSAPVQRLPVARHQLPGLLVRRTQQPLHLPISCHLHLIGHKLGHHLLQCPSAGAARRRGRSGRKVEQLVGSSSNMQLQPLARDWAQDWSPLASERSHQCCGHKAAGHCVGH